MVRSGFEPTTIRTLMGGSTNWATRTAASVISLFDLYNDHEFTPRLTDHVIIGSYQPLGN